MSAKSTLQQLIGKIGDFLEWVRDTLNDDAARRAIVADLGGDPDGLPPAPVYPATGLHSVKAYRDSADPDLEALFSAITDARSMYEALRPLAEAIAAKEGEMAADEALRALLDLLATNYWRLRHPRTYFAAQVLNFGEDATSVYGKGGNSYGRFGRAIVGILEFVLGPFSAWKQFDLGDEADARLLSDVSLQPIGAVMAFVKKLKAKDVLYGWDVVPGVPPALGQLPADPSAADIALARMLTLKFAQARKDGDATLNEEAVVSMNFVPDTQGGPAFFLSLGGGYRVDAPLAEPWSLIFELNAASAASLVFGGDKGFQFASPGSDGSDFRAALALEARTNTGSATEPDPDPHTSFELALMKGVGLRFGLVRVEATLNARAAQAKITFRDSDFSIAPKSFDGFLGKLLPADGLRLPFDFATGLARDRGAFLEGQVPFLGNTGARGPRRRERAAPPPLPPLPNPEPGAPGLALRIPIGKSLGAVTVHDLRLGFSGDGPEDERTYHLEAATSLSAKIGPVVARVERIGLRFSLQVPKDGSAAAAEANLGFANLDVGVRTPDGVGVAVDAKGVISGGGFLFHDRLQALYAGVMQLSIQDRFTVKAFGLLATRLPDGTPGYSLIVFITADDFRPYPLGMGFRLLGFGGMLALHRSFDETAMRAALLNDTLGSLLFPRDPIRKAPEIIRNLQLIFPARQHSYLGGLLAKIGWSTPTMVLFELALILEWGEASPTRLIVLGRISARLPSQKNDLIRLNMNALGLLDFDEGSLAVDAVLVDSRLSHKFVLTGAMAMRARFKGKGPGFAIAVGGLNPRFNPPQAFPKLARVAINLSSGDNPRLICEAYIALTANTVQFGARAQFYAAAYGFSISGDAGFDVLVQLLPFHLIADLQASFQLKRGSRNLFKVSFKGELEGPRPLRVAGKASFEILWCDFSIRFDKTLISGDKPPLPPAIDALAEVRAALAQPGNWNAELRPGLAHGVTLRKPATAGTLVLDPLGNLTVRQNVAPLNTARELDTFGGAPLAGARSFRITAVSLNGIEQTPTPVQDAFAPAQFFAMSDDDKLSSPSFAEMDSGIVFGSDAVAFDEAAAIASPLQYETIIVDAKAAPPAPAEAPAPPRQRYTLQRERFTEQLRFGAVAMAALRRSGPRRFEDDATAAAVELKPLRLLVASTTDLSERPVEDGATSANWVEAQGAIKALNRRSAAALWQLVPEHEVAAKLPA
jgi:hypothetical protein